MRYPPHAEVCRFDIEIEEKGIEKGEEEEKRRREEKVEQTLSRGTSRGPVLLPSDSLQWGRCN